MEILFLIIFTSHLVFTSIVLINLFSAPKINNIKKDIETQKLSILIPARNEEENIDKVIQSVLNQNLENFELLVLDDNSTDNTFSIAKKYEHPDKIKIIKGGALSQGWLGKNWACYQLSQKASGKILLFLDADVHLSNNAISYTLWLMEKFKLDMLSVFPTQITSSFGEKLIVPVMNWLLLTFLPLIAVYKSKNASFKAANGQFILIRKEVYYDIGTHSAFRQEVVEDMEIAKSVKSKKYKLITCLGNAVVSANMYKSFIDSFRGFSKNFYAGFNMPKAVFLLLLAFFLVNYFIPFIFVYFSPVFSIVILMILFQRVAISKMSKENIFLNILMHPFQMIIMFIIGMNSATSKKKLWKDRLI